MANSDKNILITPNTGSATNNPTIRFTGSDNVPITLRVLDSSTISFEGSAGQLFSISNSLTGTIFSVNDVSGIPSIEVLDTGLIKLAQYNGNVAIGSSSSTAKLTAKASSSTAVVQEWQDSSGNSIASINSSGTLGGTAFDIYPVDDISMYFNGILSRFIPRYQGIALSTTNPFRYMININGILQTPHTPEYVWLSMMPRLGFTIDSEGYIAFSEAIPIGFTFDARLMPGSNTTTVTTNYPFKAIDIILGI